jgi:BirA family transcriptional regulator, biotin operon repressor / biotin---[acetyl-CoA-carboxylase] ligase
LYKIPAKTLFLGKNMIFVPECHSTNDLALQLSQTPNWMDGTLFITDNQTAGRGQRGNIWLTEPGKNLTFSFLLKPRLPVIEQFYLTLFVSLGIRDYVTSRVTQKVQIKWPNDVIVDNKKLGGILIENQLAGNSIASSVIGIGLNINQREFPLPTATSMSCLSDQSFILDNELDLLLASLERRYLQLKERKLEQLRNDYLSALFRMNELHDYELRTKRFKGKIMGVDALGRLQVEIDNAIKVFDNKEIQYVIS